MRDLVDILDAYLQAKGKGDSSAWACKAWAIQANQTMAGKQRDSQRLFVTDVGKCHRQVKYRLIGEPRRPLSVAQRLMFEQAEDIEATVAAAMRWEGILLDYQQGVDLADRENWGGRKDITITDPLTIEVKSSRSNAFKGYRSDDMPKPAHLVQAGIYNHYDGIPAVLLYMDRGGTNPPQQFEVPELDWEQTSAEMDAYDALRESPDSPDILPQVIVRENVRELKKSRIPFGELRLSWSGEFYLQNDWRCGFSWCEYDRCPAKKRERRILMKTSVKDGVVLTSEGRRHEAELYSFLRGRNREMVLA